MCAFSRAKMAVSQAAMNSGMQEQLGGQPRARGQLQQAAESLPDDWLTSTQCTHSRSAQHMALGRLFTRAN